MRGETKIEIMSPAGNFECLMAAIQGGANSLYFGVENLNMRSSSANNFTTKDLFKISEICSEHGVKSYLTLNITLYDEDLSAAYRTLDVAKSANITAVIASDISVIQYARSIDLEVHISTQLSLSNIESVRFYAQYADVVVLARELTLEQVKNISDAIVNEKLTGPSGELVKIELFCHGALCMAISGKCHLSLHEYNRSANRGSCLQLCRRGYRVTDLETGTELEIDNQYIMSPKDLCTIEFIDKIIASGVTVLKIEGRARSAEYVKKVTSVYRRAADLIEADALLPEEEKNFTPERAAAFKEELTQVFNRGFWDGYYQGARLGEWSNVYGNSATRTKTYIGKVTNYFSNLSVAEVLIESGEMSIGDEIIIIGPTTGVVEKTIDEIRIDLEPAEKAVKGVYCSIPVPERLRKNDKIYIWGFAPNILTQTATKE